MTYAGDRATCRLGAIESAVGTDPAGIDLDYSPEQLEDDFGAEDSAALCERSARQTVVTGAAEYKEGDGSEDGR